MRVCMYVYAITFFVLSVLLYMILLCSSSFSQKYNLSFLNQTMYIVHIYANT